MVVLDFNKAKQNQCLEYSYDHRVEFFLILGRCGELPVKRLIPCALGNLSANMSVDQTCNFSLISCSMRCFSLHKKMNYLPFDKVQVKGEELKAVRMLS